MLCHRSSHPYLPIVVVSDLLQFDLKHQSGTPRDGGWGTLGSIPQGTRNGYPSLPSQCHSLHTLLHALDDFTLAKSKMEQCLALVGVECLASGEKGTLVCDPHTTTLLCLYSLPNLDVLDDQSTGEGFLLRLLVSAFSASTLDSGFCSAFWLAWEIPS